MSAYLITYFISDTIGHSHKHNDNNNHVHEETSEGRIVAKIKSLGSWGHFMPQGYVIKTSSLTSQEILSEIKSVSNPGDIIFISKLDTEAAACSHPAVIEWASEL